jgi:hypothetical protein
MQRFFARRVRLAPDDSESGAADFLRAENRELFYSAFFINSLSALMSPAPASPITK